MQSALKLTATVLPGKRVEFTAPELTEGECVEVIVLKDVPVEDAPVGVTPQPAHQFASAWDFIQSLPPSNLTAEDWERMEREFQEERNSWGD